MGRINITKQVRVEGKGWRICAVVRGGNNKLRPDVVLVDGKEEIHPEGRYYLDFLHNGKRQRLAAGGTAAEAQKAADQKALELAAHRANAAAGFAPVASTPVATVTLGKRSLRDAIDAYLLDIQAHKKPRTHQAYRISLAYFQESCRKQYLEDLTRDDMLAYKTYLKKERRQSDRSVSNRFAAVLSFLKANDINGLVKKNDMPKYTKEEVDVYSQDELTKFFAACDETEKVWFKFFHLTGMREQEVQHVTWKDIDFERLVVTMRANPEFGWTPKEDKEREIPIPLELAELLKAWKDKANQNCSLVFPTRGCRPKLNFLDECKAIAKRAGLTGDFYLHKFRATRTTEWIRMGIPTHDVMRMSGHSDYEAFRRYLGKQNIDVLQRMIEKTHTADTAPVGASGV